MASIGILPKANYKTLLGVVVNAPRTNTIRVRIPHKTWDNKLKKYYNEPIHLLANDPNNSSATGDVVKIRDQWRVSAGVKHVLTDIVSPFGIPLDKRRPIPTEAERQAARAEKRRKKDLKQAEKQRIVAIKRLAKGKKLQKKEVRETELAEKMLNKVERDEGVLKEHVLRLLFAENDLNRIEERVRDVIKLQLPDSHQWALDESCVDCLTLMVALQHAQAKQTTIGETMPLRAGKSIDTPAVQYNRKVAALQGTLASQFRGPILDKWVRDIEGSTHDFKVTNAMSSLRRRLTKSWESHVFETKNENAEAARNETKHHQGAAQAMAAKIGGRKDWPKIFEEHDAIYKEYKYQEDLKEQAIQEKEGKLRAEAQERSQAIQEKEGKLRAEAQERSQAEQERETKLRVEAWERELEAEVEEEESRKTKS
ncbi:hypothetical protein BT63DRAFT_429299 [Microthyrium microscopicum]|uniref:Ribosomal protein S17 n=1 Tax=Microthyrium microscopicum TaxID=703497 RepID=A0A6A6U093_9PEZI|nr:hypothetical protein BT63DRAFT_429299 [Microthyrium microscopicum]